MRVRRLVCLLTIVGLVAAGATAGWFYQDAWKPWLFPEPVQAAAEDHHDHGGGERVKLTSQARANLRLNVKAIEPATYWRTLRVPGVVIERPGRSDIGVTTRLTGIVEHIAAVPGDSVRPGDELFTLRLISEPLQNSQTEVYKAVRDLEINKEQRKLIEGAVERGAVPESKLLELQQQEKRFNVLRDAARQDLKARGLTTEQIAAAEAGRFLTEVTVRAPDQANGSRTSFSKLIPAPGKVEPDRPLPDQVYQLEELKVRPGELVQPGQTLATLAAHETLYIEGHGFRQDVPLLSRAAQEGWPIRVEFAEEAAEGWTPLREDFKIEFLASTVDPGTQTYAFYLRLPNEYREYKRGDKTYRAWRFRPGQRVRLHVAVEKFDNVFVLPAPAVAREGPEAYVFRQNGEVFDRKPVHIVLEDRDTIVLANDGSITPGNFIAQNAAAQLNRVLKAQTSGEGGHAGHDHAGHSHEH